MSRRAAVALGAVGALVCVAILVLVGRWEGSRHADAENAKIARIRAAVGSLEHPTGYRLLNRFSCLTYRREQNAYALELCVDANGRVVEAIDRRGAEPRFGSLREDPGAATVRVDRGEVDRLLHRLGG